jgi:hypothetical protein
MLSGFVCASIAWCVSALKESRGWRRWLAVPCSLLIGIGAVGFFGQAISTVGGFNWLPASTEWPAGRADHALTTTDGHHVVLVKGAGRIQVYDQGWHFVRGWAAGPVLNLRLLTDGTIEALMKGQRGLVFNPSGKLLSKRKYGVREWIELENSLPPGESVSVPTSAWLYIGSSPLLSWLVLAAGFAGWFTSSRRGGNLPREFSAKQNAL